MRQAIFQGQYFNIYYLILLFTRHWQSMNRRSNQKEQKSKLYNPNWLSLTHNNDLSHQKLWSQKVQEAKHIQQQKQIDRILCGIVKERLFGQLLSHQTRISDEGYYALDKMNRQLVNRTQGKKSRKISPLPNQPTYEILPRKLKSKTIDHSEIEAFKMQSSVLDNQSQSHTIKFRTRKSIDISLNKAKILHFVPVQICAEKLANLHSHFREVTSNQTSIIYEIKLTKQLLIKHNKHKGIVSQRCLERFMYFFNFPQSVNLKQYGNWIQSALSCSMNESSFFCFQVLDESQNGFLTISDLLRALQDFPAAHSSLLEKEVYLLMEKIRQFTDQLQSSAVKVIKPTTQQLIIRNQNLRIQQMKELVKQSGKQLVSASCFKSTAYHKSMYALEHSYATRQKNLHLQSSKHNGDLKSSKNVQMRQDGIRFSDYAKMFAHKRSQIFIMVAKVLIGADSAVLQ